MTGCEAERLSALEAAASAVAEVKALSEDHERLQWQSRLLERMSEVCRMTLYISQPQDYGTPHPNRNPSHMSMCVCYGTPGLDISFGLCLPCHNSHWWKRGQRGLLQRNTR